MPKPRLGFEERYKQIFRIIKGGEKQKGLSFFDKIRGKRPITQEQLIEEWFDNCIESYETIKAPRVGYDKVANEWIEARYDEADKAIPRKDFLRDHLGYYVIELAEELDGVPVYVSINQDRNVFRAQFLEDCKDLMGEGLYNQAWDSKLADETLTYGEQLMLTADKYAIDNGLLYLKDTRLPPDVDQESLESKIHILYSAAKWLIFYGKNGHGFEADF